MSPQDHENDLLGEAERMLVADLEPQTCMTPVSEPVVADAELTLEPPIAETEPPEAEIEPPEADEPPAQEAVETQTEPPPENATDDPVASPRAIARAQEREAALAVRQLLIEQAERGAITWSREQGVKEMSRLMAEWKQLPRSSKATENALWTRFKAAQDLFYGRIGLERKQRKVAAVRAAAAATRRREGTNARNEIIAQAQALIGALDIGAARAELRALNQAYYSAPSPGGDAVRKLNAEFAKIKDEFNAWAKSESSRRKDSPDRDMFITRARKRSLAAKVQADITRLENELIQTLGDDTTSKRQHGASILLTLGDSSVYGKLTADLMRQRVLLDQLNTQIAKLEAKLALGVAPVPEPESAVADNPAQLSDTALADTVATVEVEQPTIAATVEVEPPTIAATVEVEQTTIAATPDISAEEPEQATGDLAEPPAAAAVRIENSDEPDV